MNRNRTLIIILSLTIFLVLAFVAAPQITAEPQEDSFIFLPFLGTPLVPVDDYETGFEESIAPWTAARWQNDIDYDVEHNDGCSGERCEMLDISVQQSFAYVIASPLIPGPTRSYSLSFLARFDDPDEKDQYGAILSADRGDEPCPGNNVDSCFNEYYEFRARYRDEGGEKYLEYRLRRNDGHDDENRQEGKDLIEWTRADNVNAEDWNKWEIRMRASGHIFIKANNREQAASVRDNGLLDQRYFGLVVHTNESGDAKVHFDNFRINKDE
mgnify:CR=1 FL=1